MNTTPLRPVQRSEPVARGREHPADAAREPPTGAARPASLASFQDALLRAGAGRAPAGKARARADHGEDRDGDADRDAHRRAAGPAAEATAASPMPVQTSTPLALAAPAAAPPHAAIDAPAWSPRAPRPLDAVSAHLNALHAVPDGAVPGAWSLQLLDRSLPVQQLDIQRSAAGALRVALSASPETARNAPLERLRQRLVARGSAPESLVYRQAREALDE